MNPFRILIALCVSVLFVVSCSRNKNPFDASGSFEAEETIVSSGASGLIMELNIEEGQSLLAGQQIGYIDTVQLFLRKKQLESQVAALMGRKPNVGLQLSSLQEQLKAAQKEQQRLVKLVNAEAATQKQLDDANAQVEVLRKQVEAQNSTLTISSEGIGRDAAQVQVQIEQTNDLLKKSKIVNPVNGTVLVKYANVDEMTASGKPLYKIADLSAILLRAYITGDQLPLVQLNQEVSVHTDDGKGGFNESKGTVIWISDKAEFTPKTIQTKDERANLVYAIKVKVKNDGQYKIGMYGEIKF